MAFFPFLQMDGVQLLKCPRKMSAAFLPCLNRRYVAHSVALATLIVGACKLGLSEGTRQS